MCCYLPGGHNTSLKSSIFGAPISLRTAHGKVDEAWENRGKVVSGRVLCYNLKNKIHTLNAVYIIHTLFEKGQNIYTYRGKCRNAFLKQEEWKMGRSYYSEKAEREADKIGEKFAHSSNVMQDMARAYHTDFSNIRIHTDAAADSRVKAAGKDALAAGNDLFFGKDIFESSHPAAKALVGHELAHTMQQGVVGGEMAVQETAPMGAEQGGKIWNWFKGIFSKKKNPEDEVSLTSMPDDDTLKGKALRERWFAGTKGRGDAKMINPKRADLDEVLRGRYKDMDKDLNDNLKNASGTVEIKGLRYNRMIKPLMRSAGGDATTEEIVGMYDNLLGVGQGEGIEARDAQFDAGFLQLKQTYLAQLRRMKEKYGTYPTQMHPEDFINKVGMDFFDDMSIMQDTEQMMVYGAKYFDYSNPDDAEFKLLSDYYNDANSQLSIYISSDMNVDNLAEFNPSEEALEIVGNNEYLTRAKEGEQKLRENNEGIKGFTDKQMGGYIKRLQKRFSSKDMKKRLFGRFKK